MDNPINIQSDNKRYSTAIILFLVLSVFFIASIWVRWIFIAFCSLLLVVMTIELTNALRKNFKPLYYIPILVASFTMLAPTIIWWQYKDLTNWYLLNNSNLPLDANWQTNFIWLLAYGALTFIIAFVLVSTLNVVIRVVLKGPNHLPHAIAENTSALYVAIPMVSIVLFTFAVPNGFIWLVLALITPMIVDIAAYTTGKYLGKTHMLPKVSPHKTWEGFWGGTLAGTLFTCIYFMIFFTGNSPLQNIGKSSLFGLVAGLILSISSQLGDWLASSLKRWCDQKDFGDILPGHGGVLDRTDSIIFSVPTALILAIVFYLLKH